MLVGEFPHSVDVKGRMNFPSKFREDMGESFIITKGQNYCLYAYSMEEWDNLVSSIKALPRSKRQGLEHFFIGSATQAVPDKQGRVLVPQNLRTYAGIEKDVYVVGASDRAEIWSKDRWEETCAALSPELIAAQMEELGF